jgi:uncharacterized protein (TIGR00369 family)
MFKACQNRGFRLLFGGMSDDSNSSGANGPKDGPKDRATLAERMVARAVSDPREEFGSFFLSRLLGFVVTYGEQTCSVSFDVTPVLFNPQGTLHGGILATALDVSMGHLLSRMSGPGTTLEMKVQYMSAITAGHVRCEASFLRQGRGISFLQSTAFREDGQAAAHATATWKLLNRASSRNPT